MFRVLATISHCQYKWTKLLYFNNILVKLPGAEHQQILCLFCFNGNAIFAQSNVDNGLDESSENRQRSRFPLEAKTGMAVPFLLPTINVLLLQDVSDVLIPSVLVRRLRTSSEESTSSL